MPAEKLHERVNAIRSTAEVIAESLKEMIHEADLKPGQPLVQETIARMFQVSRIPVRDALALLVRSGLAVNIPRRGVIVRPLTRELLADLFEVRGIVEGAAARRAAERATPALVRELRALIREQGECLETGDVRRHENLDDRFHRAYYRDVGNDVLRDLLFQTWERTRQARSASTVDPAHGRPWIAASIRRHKALLAPLVARDPDAACRVVLDVIAASQDEIVRSLEQMGWLEPRRPKDKEAA